MVLRGYPHSVVQRGHNRQAVFAEERGYLSACCRYVELNPVRAKMVENQQGYQWSSYRDRIGENVAFPAYDDLGGTAEVRAGVYSDFVSSTIPAGE